MRQITQDSVNAFLHFQRFNKQNMSVQVIEQLTNSDGDITPKQSLLLLHGNIIAKIVKGVGLFITNAGWATNTTKDRLNALPNVSIQQKNFVWYLNGKEWDGEWIKVK